MSFFLPWRFVLLICVWGTLLVCGWIFTTDRFLLTDKSQFPYQTHSEFHQYERFLSDFQSLFATFSNYTRFYSYDSKRVAQNPTLFWTSASEVLSSIRSQHQYFMQLQKKIPVGDPLRTSTQKELRISFLFLSSFGKRKDPITHQWGFHTGIDLEAREGDPVFATADGVVLSSNENSDYGRNIQIAHSYGFQTLYAHLSAIESNIVSGKKIYQGQKLGVVGHTGRATGSHLHYEVRNQGLILNPGDYLALGKILT